MGSQSTGDLIRRLRWSFYRLMSNLVSNSNTDRAKAEEFLLHLSKNQPALLCHRTALLLCSPRSEMRFVSAILLRQFFTLTSHFYVWLHLSASFQQDLKTNLLLALEEEKFRHVANAKSDTIAQLVSNFVPLHPHYPEILHFVLIRINMREPPVLAEASLRIFAQIAKPLVHILEERPLIIRTSLLTCIDYLTPSHVRLAALSALCSLLQSLPSSKDRNQLQKILVKGLTKIDITDVPRVLELLIDLAGAEPNFVLELTKHTNIVVDMLAVAENSQSEEGTRHLALEFVITLAEARNSATGISSILFI